MKYVTKPGVEVEICPHQGSNSSFVDLKFSDNWDVHVSREALAALFTPVEEILPCPFCGVTPDYRSKTIRCYTDNCPIEDLEMPTPTWQRRAK